MEIDDIEFLNLGLDDTEPKSVLKNTVYTKKTLLHSPIICNIFPRFYVQHHKNIRSIRNLSLQDDNMQYAAFQEEDSQFGVFSDDEMLFDTDEVSDAIEDKEREIDGSQGSKLRVTTVIVKNTSILVNDRQFGFNSPVRSCCLLKGIRNDQIQEEDSLMVSLKSGFMLLIRLFCVPVKFSDTDGNFEGEIEIDHQLVYKPFVVQWWDTSSQLPAPSIFSSGATLMSHVSGLSAVSTAFCGGFRVYNCDHSQFGVFLQNHYTVPIDGTILHSCFAKPLKDSILDNHVMYLIMVFTNDNRLKLELYGWMTSGSIHTSLTKSTLPLEGTFKTPIFVVSLGNSGSFLLVNESELTIITVHDITSAEYNFRRVSFPGSFPTGYYCPETKIVDFGDDSRDEVLISTDNGVIYSVIVQNNEIQLVKPIIRISDPISVFSLESSGEGFELVYGSTVGLNRKLFIDSLLKDVLDTTIPYSQSLLIQNYKNWAPMLDTQVIDSYKSKSIFQSSKQELWCISGTGKRSRLSQLRHGYLNSRIGDSYPSLRKTESMSSAEVDGVLYIGCSLPFSTVVLAYHEQEEVQLEQIDDLAISGDVSTLAFGKTPGRLQDDRGDDRGELVVQVTSRGIIVSSMETVVFSKDMDGSVIMADIMGSLVLVVVVKANEAVLEVLEVGKREVEGEVEEDGGIVEVYCKKIDFDISFAKLFSIGGEQLVIMGSFDGLVIGVNVAGVAGGPVGGLACVAGESAGVTLSDSIVFKISLKSVIQTDSDLVPDDTILINDNLFLGTKDGYLLHFKINNLQLKIECHYHLSDIAVKLHKIGSVLVVVCGSLWILDIEGMGVPEPVLFEEKNDKTIKSVLPIPNGSKNSLTMIMVREDGLCISKLRLCKVPVVKQINLGESAKKFIYLSQMSIFAVISNSDNRNARLRFVDRKTFKLLSHSEFDSKNRPFEAGDSIFDPDETPTCLKVWSLDKFGRISKKLLVGCSTSTGKGAFKVLDVSKSNGPDNRGIMKITHLNSFEHSSPITCIEQLDSTIFFSSGRCLYSTSYNFDEKRLNPVASLVTLTSDITSITAEDEGQGAVASGSTGLTLTITTKLDSVIQFQFKPDVSYKECLVLCSKDPAPKSVVNHAVLGPEVVVSDRVHSDILVMKRDVKDGKDLVPCARFKSFGVPRVFAANMDSMWVGTSAATSIIVVTVDGEITLLKRIDEDSKPYTDLKSTIPIKVVNEQPQFSMERWDIPFQDKVGGKGFKSINKAYFRNVQNKIGLIDYDLGEINCCSYTNL